jgi:hypothetical protein
MRKWGSRILLGSVCALAAWTAPAARAAGDFELHLEQGDVIPDYPQAMAAFQAAAAVWEQYIASPIRVNIFVDYVSFPSAGDTIIGATSLGDVDPNLDYTTVRNAMAARASRPGNEILGYLPTRSQVSANVRSELGAVFDTTTIGVTSANQKAMGLISGTDPRRDGVILFNSNFAFDFDPSDGIDADKIDFRTAAVHEIGHVLGFLSDVDDYDRTPNISDNATTLDLFRFDATMLPKNSDEFTHFPREMRPGAEASFSDLSNIYPMSTGAISGDTRQASHWKDDFIFQIGQDGGLIAYFGPLIGVMDPTLPGGISEAISPADLRALELIGYDIVPEPGMMGVLLLAGALLLRRRNAPDSALPRGRGD